MFTIYGGKTEFEQWDLDQLVSNPCMKEGNEIVFRNSHGETYVTRAFKQGGEVLADVPNYLLQKHGNILVTLEQGADRHTECETIITVTAKDKPEDYKCGGNIKERKQGGAGDTSATYEESITVTVGGNGDYATIGAALTALSEKYPVYKAQGLPVTVKILSGTTINEQISVVGLDLSYITITAEDAEVPVNVDGFTDQGLNAHDLRSNAGAFIGGENAAGIPTVACLFKVSQNTSNIKVVGYFANRSSHGVVKDNSGFDGFYDGVISNNESSVTIRNGIARNNTRYGVHARHNGEVSARSCDITNNGMYGGYADRAANLDVREAIATGSAIAVNGEHASNICAAGCHALNCGKIAISKTSAIVDCSLMEISGTTTSVFTVEDGGMINAYNLTFTDSGVPIANIPMNALDKKGVIWGGTDVDLHFYVSTTGSDTNDGSATAPFATVQKAFAMIPDNLGGRDVTVELLSDITTDSPIECCYKLGGNIKLVGNDHTIESSNATKGYRFRSSDGEIVALLFAGVHIALQDIGVSISTTGGHAICCWDGCVVDFPSAHSDSSIASVHCKANNVCFKMERGCTSGSCGSEQNFLLESYSGTATGTGLIVKHASYLISGGSINAQNLGTAINCTGGIISAKTAPVCTNVTKTYNTSKGGRVFVGAQTDLT